MFFQLLYIHLFRPFLKYTQATSPLPSHVSPRKLCTQAAGMISKLMRLYKRSHGLRQIVNFAIYVVHSACTIHLLNLPDKSARRDIIHGVKHLEEMAEGWLVARRTLNVMSMQARKWRIDLPEEAAAVLCRTDAKFGLAASPFASTSPKLPLQSSESSLSSLSYAVPPQLSQSSQAHLDWPQTIQPLTKNAGLLDFSMSTDDKPLQFSASISAASQFNPQIKTMPHITPNYPLTPVLQDFGLRASLPAHRQSSSTGLSASHQQASTGTIQVPVFSMQQQQQELLSQKSTSSSQHQQRLQPEQQQARPVTQAVFRNPALTTTSLQQYQVTPAGNSTSSVPTPDMFGGVEALLREGQEWWMKDQSHDLASGFNNWNGIGNLDGSDWRNKKQQQRQGQAQRQAQLHVQSQFQSEKRQQPQLQQQQMQQQMQQQATVQHIPSPQQPFQHHPLPPKQRQLYPTQQSSTLHEEHLNTSTPIYNGVHTIMPDARQQSTTGPSGKEGDDVYDFGNLKYNEAEWYQ